MNQKLKKSLPLLIGTALVGSLTGYYLKNREKWQKENREIDFQKVTFV